MTHVIKYEGIPELTGSLGATASAEGAFKSASLLPPKIGELTLGAKLGAKGSLEQTLGEGAKFAPKASGTASLEAGFKSPALRGPAATLGGLLGEKSRLALGAETSFSTAVEPEKGLSSKLGAAGTLGLTGVGGQEPFIKLKVSGEAAIDLQKGEIESDSQALVVGVSTGFKF